MKDPDNIFPPSRIKDYNTPPPPPHRIYFYHIPRLRPKYFPNILSNSRQLRTRVLVSRLMVSRLLVFYLSCTLAMIFVSSQFHLGGNYLRKSCIGPFTFVSILVTHVLVSSWFGCVVFKDSKLYAFGIGLLVGRFQHKFQTSLETLVGQLYRLWKVLYSPVYSTCVHTAAPEEAP